MSVVSGLLKCHDRSIYSAVARKDATGNLRDLGHMRVRLQSRKNVFARRSAFVINFAVTKQHGGSAVGRRRMGWVTRYGAAALFFLVCLTVACGSPQAPTHDQEAKTAVEGSAAPSHVKRPDIGFASRQKLVDHYKKHGREFGAVTMEQYLRKAQELRDRPAGGAILESVRPDGAVSRYDREKGDFLAFNSDGVIRTYFRPTDGEAYYRRQLGRKQ